jgi:hypothetical protein
MTAVIDWNFDGDCRLRRYVNLQTKNGASSVDHEQALLSALKVR